MWLNLRQRVDRIVVEESNDDKALILIVTKHVQSYWIECEGHRLRDVTWVVSDELKELLDIRRTALIELGVIDVDYDLLKVVLFLLPLQFVLSTSSTILAEIFVEEPNC